MKSFFKKFSILAFMLTLLYLPTKADEIQIGTGTANSAYPFNGSEEDAVTFLLYRQAEILAAGGGQGVIRGVSFDIVSPVPVAFNGFTIFMQNTALQNISSPIQTGWTQVYTTTAFVPVSSGWTKFSFPSHTFFNYSGENLMLKVCFNNFNIGGAATNVRGTSVAGTALARYGSGDGCATTFTGFNATPARANIKLDMLTNPKLMAIYPPAVPPTVITAGSVIPFDSDLHPAVDVKRAAGQDMIYVSYKIVGPSNNPSVIYEATVPGNTNQKRIPIDLVGDPVPAKYKFTSAVGVAAHIAPGGDPTGQLDFSNPGIQSGEYTVHVTFEVGTDTSLTEHFQQTFNISLPWDMVAYGIPYPLHYTVAKYPMLGPSGVPMGITVLNAGLNPVDSFRVEARVFKDGALVYEPPSIVWVNTANPLLTGNTLTIPFQTFQPTAVGEYEMVVNVVLLNSQDLNLENNIYPAPPVRHKFQVTHRIDGVAESLLMPTGNIFVNRPVPPIAVFRNNGFEDILDAYANIEIKNAQGVTVFTDTILVTNVPAAPPFTSTIRFNNEFIPTSLGLHTSTLKILHPDEGYPIDNTLNTTFTVIQGMQGPFRVCATCTTATDFATLDDAIDALFTQGITGPVVIELTEDVYTLGSNDAPFALDLRSKIVGASETNTITIRPSEQKMLTRGSVLINLHSASGIGMIFGQSHVQTFSGAAVNFVNFGQKKKFANSEGYFIIDGGANKSLEFKMHAAGAGHDFRSAFYMHRGAKNITIQNCLINGQNPSENGSPNYSTAYSLPRVSFEYSIDKGLFIFEPDVRPSGTYSAGVVLRNTPPFFANTMSNYFVLDTMNITNIQIKNNEISHFGYGIVSLGNGYLNYLEGPKTTITKYFNHNNKYVGNMIHNVARAGIFLGYEEHTDVANNRIFDISASNEIAGIMLGGLDEVGFNGYMNNNIRIDGNEISNIQSDNSAFGVKIEQSSFTMQESLQEAKFFPTVKEEFIIVNNIIRDFHYNLPSAHRVGIFMATSRSKASSYFDENMITPLNPEFFIKDNLIANNTISFGDDGGVVNTGNLAGIAFLQSKRTNVANNAISILDASIHPLVQTRSAFFYSGVKPNANDNKFDRNAYWLADNIDFIRFVETHPDNRIFNLGTPREFQTLNQWRNFSGMDKHSVVYNFMNDLFVSGAYPQKLRAKNNPAPLNSMINNRGDRIDEVAVDIDGNPRGTAHQRYDIGASEFAGRMFNSDIEVSAITAPGAYTDLLSPMFQDAEYIMTVAPIEVKANVRNNGNMYAASRRVKVEIFREDTLGNFPNTPILTKEVTVNVAATDNSEVVFGLGDGLDNDDFYPLAYSQLSGYTVPEQFRTMTPNVTPRHKIRISLPQSDEVLGNNMLEDKIVRFYLKRSKLSLVLSMENSHKEIISPATPTVDEIAGRLNADTLIGAFNKIGWFQTRGEADHDFDIFERRGWEPRSVDYTLYRSLIHSDAHDKKLSRTEIQDVVDFVNTGLVTEKKNLILASQEVVRENSNVAPIMAEGTFFVNNILRAVYSETRPTADTLQLIRGSSIARNLNFPVKPTGFLGDASPNGDISGIFNTGYGLSRVAFYYVNPSAANLSTRIMSVATSTVTNNTIYFGTDWRHFGQADAIIRATMDFIESNGGIILPVELLSFEANPVGNRVELNWATASEINSSRFDIERAEILDNQASTFVKIDEMRAGGNSSVALEYGPVIDRTVKMGNSYSYRLKMIDISGEFGYSDERIVTMGNGDAALAINNITPNPANDMTRLMVNIPAESSVTIDVYDMTGRKIVSQYHGVMASGITEITLDTKEIASGNYHIILTAGTAQAGAALKVVK